MNPLDRAAQYDAENPWSADDDFFLALANRKPNSRILDLGCGTGRLTIALAAAGHHVTGVDPDSAAIAWAQTKAGADKVTWLVGDSRAVPEARFDLALMTAHVAQAIWQDGAWKRTLHDLAAALVPDGRLAFDSRDPAARIWETWHGSRRTLALPDGTTAENWYEVISAENELITFVDHTLLPDGADDAERATLTFRTLNTLREDVAAAGFAVDTVYGGWNGEPVGAGCGEFVVLTHRVRTGIS